MEEDAAELPDPKKQKLSVEHYRLERLADKIIKESNEVLSLTKSDKRVDRSLVAVSYDEKSEKVSAKVQCVICRQKKMISQIVGLMLPLSENGTPVENCFRFTTLRNVKEFIEKNSLSSYAKLITIRSIMPKATTYHLVIYGTQGSDRHVDVKQRWEYIMAEFAKRGIECLTFSSDGAPAFMKTMQLVADIPMHSNCKSILI